MRKIRPRGLSFSSSSVRYVGQAWRQNPQWTHALIPGNAAARGVPSSAHGRDASAGVGDSSSTEKVLTVIASCAEDTGIENVLRVERAFDSL